MPDLLRLEEAVEFAENPEPRCPCILLLDVSGSMSGAPIQALNEGLKVFQKELSQDNLAKKRVEVAIVAFSDTVQVVQDFANPDDFTLPILTAGGLTHTGTAINKALDMIQARKTRYRVNGVSYYRPWVFLITDGEPQGEPVEMVAKAAQRIHDEETSKRMAFFAVGVEGANLSRLSQLSVRSPLQLKGLSFRELFIWLSASLESVSHSKLDDQVPLQSPAGWAEI
jgi:uncharacterized protein YegL